jgi:N-acetylmuramoyl-L-alanine amidase
MKNILLRNFAVAITCVTNPYKASEKEYDNKLKTFKDVISNKEPEPLPTVSKAIISIDNAILTIIHFKDTIQKWDQQTCIMEFCTEWISNVNFNLRNQISL